MRQFPWFSFSLLFLACTVFGWVVSTTTEAIPVLILLGSFLLLIDMGLTAPITIIELLFGSWLASDKRAFLTVLVLAFSFAVFLTWINIFARLLVLLAAGTLFRLDLQRTTFKRWQALTILLLTCASGYIGGVLIHTILA
ncbi:hypothetical protein FRE64_15790 [Euhalothece natronophila Z-M001]|uniref:Uncharacterized protein n=2 Tax=Euhalothece TaxID=65097 RepID=A0A5B8NRX9_9CHRO|nr:hypothetical protein FRE64_15790 [Euhalothece natronophila Z-M001]